jgi:signal recognition particle receptor subunit beta
LGHKFLETGNLPTTDTITVLTGAKIKPGNNIQTDSSIATTHTNSITLHQVSNLPLLEDLTLVDTPGTNAVLTSHTTRTLKLLPNADLILFVTSADRPFPESERKLIQSIQAYRKNIVICVNKMDVLDASGGHYGEAEKLKVVNFVRENAADLLGANTVVLSVSSKDALAAKLIHGGDKGAHTNELEASQVWKRSMFADLEAYLKDSLTEDAKVKAKLLNPVGVTEGILGDSLSVLTSREKELLVDTATVNLLNNQMESWLREMGEDMKIFRGDSEGIMRIEMERCQVFFGSLSALDRFSCLMSGNNKLLVKWNESQSAITSKGVEDELLGIVQECSENMATLARGQGQAVIEYLGKRPAVVGQNLIGSVTAASRFEDTRKNLFSNMSSAVNNVISTYDAESEKDDIISSMKSFMYASTFINASGLTVGIMTALEMVDLIIGGISAGSLVLVGISIIPYSNRVIVQKHEESWKRRRSKLDEALESICSKEVKRMHKKILNGVSPYTTYVKTQKEEVGCLKRECDELQSVAQILRNRVNKL